jgi:response regulator RpfG family c-di-GMP phosphodiesterase
MIHPFALSARTTVVVIDGERSHLAELTAGLSPYFNVTGFTDSTRTILFLAENPPGAIVLDERVFPRGGASILAQILALEGLAGAPIICTSETPNSDFFPMALAMGACKTFAKPVSLRSLISAIEDAVGRALERTWEDIEPVQRSALTKTVAAFNGISDLVIKGEPLPLGRVRESCEPLVEAVRRDDYKEMLRGVRGHDNYSYVHSLRVATFLSLFGHRIGIKGDDLLTLATGGLVHDIGKATIPFDILNKPGRLQGEEWELMKSHVTRTEAILERSPDIPKAVMTVASQHHEKLDGSGYPRGLKGRRLNDLARMATIVDVFGALTDRRVYKDPIPPEEALGLMQEMKGELDQHFLALFREMLLDAASLGRR